MPVQSRARIEGCRADAFIPVQAVDTVTAQEERSGGCEGWGRSNLSMVFDFVQILDLQ
jgi:hypothetical protein